jgi:hypothetical protein
MHALQRFRDDLNSSSWWTEMRPPSSTLPLWDHMNKREYYFGPVDLSLSAESVSHLTVFFSHNKSVNSTFSYDFSDKRQTLNLFQICYYIFYIVI